MPSFCLLQFVFFLFSIFVLSSYLAVDNMQIVMYVVVEIALRYYGLFILNIEYQDLRFISGLLLGNDEKPNCFDQR